jgi:UDP-2-acetamido-3-amino-2,3-dideoxy-glucuronate N-acetyltransferase
VSPLSARAWLQQPAPAALGVGGARLVRLQSVEEERGLLTVGEVERHIPFPPRRYFVISAVPDENIRGEHAHLAQHQLLVCLAGRVTAEVDDGSAHAAIVLDTPRAALYMPPMTWGAQHHYSRDAVLLVLASHEYDPADYVRDYASFTKLARGGR